MSRNSSRPGRSEVIFVLEHCLSVLHQQQEMNSRSLISLFLSLRSPKYSMSRKHCITTVWKWPKLFEVFYVLVFPELRIFSNPELPEVLSSVEIWSMSEAFAPLRGVPATSFLPCWVFLQQVLFLNPKPGFVT